MGLFPVEAGPLLDLSVSGTFLLVDSGLEKCTGVPGATHLGSRRLVALSIQVTGAYLTDEQWFSTFPALRLFNTVPHVAVTSNHNIIFVATTELILLLL